MRLSSLPGRLSISTRLALWYGISMLVLLGLFVLYLYTSFHLSLHRDFSQNMQRTKQSLLRAVAVSDGMPEFRTDGSARALPYASVNTYVRLLSARGDVVGEGSGFGGRAAFEPRVPSDKQEHTFVHRWDGASARSLYTPVRSSTGQLAGWLEITRLESSIHRELHRLAWLLGVGIFLGTALSVGGGYLLARRALRPVARLTDAANAIQAQDLSRRLPRGVGDELSDLADAFNQMLDRLQRSFEREKQFRADAAHELMTPLSAAQSEIEVTLWSRRRPAEYEASLEGVLGNVRRMSAIVEVLLDLSHAEALAPSGRVTDDVGAVVLQQLRRIDLRPERSELTIEREIQPDVAARIRTSDVERVISNLLDNAVKYTPTDGTVRISVRANGEDAVIDVRDTGIGFTAEERQRLFDRFYRSDRAGVQQQPGTGLGLSVIEAVVRAYDGKVSADSAGPGCGSRFTVRLPRA